MSQVEAIHIETVVHASSGSGMSRIEAIHIETVVHASSGSGMSRIEAIQVETFLQISSGNSVSWSEEIITQTIVHVSSGNRINHIEGIRIEPVNVKCDVCTIGTIDCLSFGDLRGRLDLFAFDCAFSLQIALFIMFCIFEFICFDALHLSLDDSRQKRSLLGFSASSEVIEQSLMMILGELCHFESLSNAR